jgi:signal transduction histidine kinase
MSIYRKTLILLGVALILLVGLLYVTARYILLESFTALEAQDTRLNVERVFSAIENRIASLGLVAASYSSWDDTRDFVLQTSPEAHERYIAVNLDNSNFIDTGFDVAIFVNTAGEIIYQKMVDPERAEAVPVPESLVSYVEVGSPLLNHPTWSSKIGGFILLPEGPLMVVSLPVLDNLGQGPDLYGTMIWGHWFTEADIAELAQDTHLNLTMPRYDAPNLGAEFLEFKADPALQNGTWVHTHAEDLVEGYALIQDIVGEPALILRLEMPRPILQQGLATFNVLLGAILVIGLILSVLILSAVDRLFLRRVQRLSSVVNHVRTTGDLKAVVETRGSDELSNLARGLQTMWRELDQSRHSLQDANNLLEQRVEERTTELRTANTLLQDEIQEREQVQRELAVARDQALESLHVKNQILANISHDARTPLTLIMLRCEMAQMGMYGEISPKARTAFDEIVDGAKQLINFMTNMLTEAQLSRGSVKFTSEAFDPAALVEGLIKSMEPLAKRKGIELRLEPQAELPSSLLGDTTRLKQIVTNLVDNAVKFTTKGEVVVSVSPQEAARWMIEVRDTGPGIPADSLSRIFEAFWQVDGSVTREANRGVGLGLSIVHQLVERMGGQIQLESEVGKGSTFRVFLPAVLPASITVSADHPLQSVAAV